MLDAAKYADLVLLLIDGSFGFEMETFEFLNLLQVWGNEGSGGWCAGCTPAGIYSCRSEHPHGLYHGYCDGSNTSSLTWFS